MEEFLKAGIPIGKVDRLRPLLEKNGYRLVRIIIVRISDSMFLLFSSKKLRE